MVPAEVLPSGRADAGCRNLSLACRLGEVAHRTRALAVQAGAFLPIYMYVIAVDRVPGDMSSPFLAIVYAAQGLTV